MASKTIEEAVVVKLKATSSVTTFVGSGANARIYWMKAPPSTTLPYIVISTVSRPNVPQEIGYNGSQARVQISSWHNQKTNGQLLAQAVVEVFDFLQGNMDGYDVYCTTTGPVQMEDPDHDKLYQCVVDVIIDYRR